MAEHGYEFIDIEREIAAELRKQPQTRDGQAASAMPGVGASPSPTLAPQRPPFDAARAPGNPALAVVKEYDAAAGEIETTGAELVERARQCEAMVREALALNDELTQAAERLRRKARVVSAQIENCSQMSSDVRRTWSELRGRLAFLSPNDDSLGLLNRLSDSRLDAAEPVLSSDNA